jgi:hypothetical protein
MCARADLTRSPPIRLAGSLRSRSVARPPCASEPRARDLALANRTRACHRCWNSRLTGCVEEVHLGIEEFEIKQQVKGSTVIFRLAKAIKSHRESTRTRRDLESAINNAATPSMRDELILVGQRADALR